MKCLYLLTRKGKLEANRLLQIFLMDFRDLMAWMTDLAMRISSGEPAKNVREAEALLELHTERKVPYQREAVYMKWLGRRALKCGVVSRQTEVQLLGHAGLPPASWDLEAYYVFFYSLSSMFGNYLVVAKRIDHIHFLTT